MNQYPPPGPRTPPPAQGDRPPPPAPGYGPQQQYPGQWYGHTSPRKGKPPVSALWRLGVVLVTLLVVLGVMDLVLSIVPRLFDELMGQVIALGLSLIYLILLLGAVGVSLASIIVGIIVFVRLPSGKVRNGALLIVLAALVGSGAVATGTSGDSVPHAVWIVVTAIRWVSGLLAIVLGIIGLAALRRSTDLRM